MRIQLSLLLTIVLGFSSFQNSFSQTNCGADPVHQFLMENNEAYRLERALVESKIQQHKSNSTERRSTYTIPVVVHIMHKGEAVGVGTNITDTRVMQAIQGANDRWNDMNGPGPNMDVEFCLAKTDPNGNPTNGINRVNASGVTDYLANGLILTYEGNSNELELKNLSNWPHDKYYNIWVITKFNAGWGGYAYYASVSNFAIDGAAIISTSMNQNTSLVAHELGHGLGLFHTFEGASDATCPNNSNCATQGDRVCDTPPHTQNQCNSTNCSTEGDLNRIFDNYMSYCGGLNRFTQGQKDRVDASLLNTNRNDLLTAGTCNLPCIDINLTLNAVTCDPSIIGTTIDTFVAFNGCDSIVTTIINLIPGVTNTVNATTCDPSIVGTTVDTFVAFNTCDSIVTIITTLITAAATADFEYTVSGLQVSFTNNSSNEENVAWDFGDGASQSGGDNVNHTYSTPDVYEVSIIASNICGVDTANQMIDLSVSSISLADQIELVQVTPNPNNGTFTLQLKGDNLNEPLQLYILDLAGKVIDNRSIRFSGNETLSYQLKNISSGVYYLKMQSGNSQPYTLPFEVVR